MHVNGDFALPSAKARRSKMIASYQISRMRTKTHQRPFMGFATSRSHLSQATRSTASVAIRSPKIIAPSRVTGDLGRGVRATS